MLMTGYFGGYSTQPSALAALEHAAAAAMVDLVRGQRKPVAVHTIFPDGPTGLLLRAAGIPVHRDVDRAAAVLAGSGGAAGRRAGRGHACRRRPRR